MRTRFPIAFRLKTSEAGTEPLVFDAAGVCVAAAVVAVGDVCVRFDFDEIGGGGATVSIPLVIAAPSAVVATGSDVVAAGIVAADGIGTTATSGTTVE